MFLVGSPHQRHPQQQQQQQRQRLSPQADPNDKREIDFVDHVCVDAHNDNDDHDVENATITVVDDAKDDKVHSRQALPLLSKSKHSQQQQQHHHPQYRQLFLAGTYFLYNACVASVVPFMGLFFHDLGLDSAAIGGLQSLRTILTFLVGPLWGALSDRTRRPVLVMVVSVCPRSTATTII